MQKHNTAKLVIDRPTWAESAKQENGNLQTCL